MKIVKIDLMVCVWYLSHMYLNIMVLCAAKMIENLFSIITIIAILIVFGCACYKKEKKIGYMVYILALFVA